MKNIMVIDGALNCVYDIFQASDDEFALIFPGNTDIAFIEDVWSESMPEEHLKLLGQVFQNLWNRPVKKRDANGIHGLLFYELKEKKIYYPTLRDEEAVNPNGSRLRAQ